MTDVLVACRPKDCTPEMQTALDAMKGSDFSVRFLYTDDHELDPRLKDRVLMFQTPDDLTEDALDEARMMAESFKNMPESLLFGKGDHDGDSMLPKKHYEQKIPHMQRGGYLGRDKRR